MNEQETKMKLPGLDELFTTQKQRDDKEKDYIEDISIELIDDFPNHPFSVNDDELMDNIVKSINNNGFIPPSIIRPKENGRFEMVSGHRRKLAFIKAHKNKMPCIKKELTDDEATILMVDTNINQRQEILPSEKAFAYKMKYEALKHQGKRTDLEINETSLPMETKLRTDEKIGKENGESATQVFRYIRLTYLMPELLKLVDEKRIAFRPAVDISYLPEDYQCGILNTIEYDDISPSVAQAVMLKKMAQEGTLTLEKVEALLAKQKPNQREYTKIPTERISKLIPESIKQKGQVEDFIVKCVEDYIKRQRNKEMAR